MTEPFTTTFDEECRPLHLKSALAAPADALRDVQRVLETVAQRLIQTSSRSDAEYARQAIETVRAALTVLDAVGLQRPASAVAQAKTSRRLLTRLFGHHQDQPPRPEPRLVVDIGRVLDATRNALESADRMRAAEPPPPEILTRPWAQCHVA